MVTWFYRLSGIAALLLTMPLACQPFQSNTEMTSSEMLPRDREVGEPRLPGDDATAEPVKTTRSFYAIADATVNSQYGGSNYGSSASLAAGTVPRQDSYLKFAVSGLSGTVTSAKIAVFAYDGTVNGPVVHATSPNWSESTLTWNNRPAATTGQLDDRGTIGANSWAYFNVTSVVRGNGTYSFALVPQSSDRLLLRSRNFGYASYFPKLIITTSAGTVSPAPIPSPTPTAIATPVPAPSPTPVPTATPVPVPSPVPTSTPIQGTAGAIRFAVIGDYGWEGAALRDVSNMIKSQGAEFIITTGDNNYDYGEASTIDRNIGQYFAQYIGNYKGTYGAGALTNNFFPTLGNHDTYTLDGQAYYDYFTLPNNERYYDFVRGNVHFFALNSTSDADGNYCRSDTDCSKQGLWLKAKLASSTARWKVVFFHHAPYSSDKRGPMAWMQWPFKQWGVHAVFAGHAHFYERLSVGGLPYFVNGISGRSIYSFGTVIPESQFRYNGNYGAQIVDATSEGLDIQFYDRNGALIDRLLLGTMTNEQPVVETRAFQEGIGAYTGAADTYLSENNPTSVYGGFNSLLVDSDSPSGSGRDLASLMRWSLSGIPAGSKVTGASITIDVFNTSGGSYELFEVKRNWDESSASWNQAAYGQAWEAPGAKGAADRGSLILGSVTPNTTGKVTMVLNPAGINLVQRWLDSPSANFGLIMGSSTNGDGADFYSNDYALASSRPELKVTFAPGSGEPTAPTAPTTPPATGGSLPVDVVLSATTGASIGGTRGADKPIGYYVPELYSAVSMRASRGETLGLFLRHRVSTCDTVDIAWRGTSPNGVTTQLFDLPKITTTNPSFSGAFVGEHFDAAVPNASGNFCPAVATGGGFQEVWQFLDVAVPGSTAPGLYTAEVKLRNAAVTFTLSLKVYPMIMPEQLAMPTYFINSSWGNMLQHYGGWNDQEVSLQAKYLKLLRDHRITSLRSAVGRPNVITVNGQLLLDINTYSFNTLFVTNRNSNVMFDIPGPKEDWTQTQKDNYWIAVENTIRHYGWAGKAFFYVWDEPTDADYPAVIALIQRIKSFAPSIKIMITEYAAEALKPYVDIFVPVAEQYGGNYPGFAEYETLKTGGKKAWWYISCMSHGCGGIGSASGRPDFSIDATAPHVRSIGWLNHKYKLQGFLYYMTNHFYYKGNPWVDQWDYGGNGDGNMIYPGKPGLLGFTEHQPVASLRMKLFRESSFDAEYLKWAAAAKPSWFDYEFAGLVPDTRNWSRDYQKFQEFRDKLGDYLETQFQ